MIKVTSNEAESHHLIMDNSTTSLLRRFGTLLVVILFFGKLNVRVSTFYTFLILSNTFSVSWPASCFLYTFSYSPLHHISPFHSAPVSLDSSILLPLLLAVVVPHILHANTLARTPATNYRYIFIWWAVKCPIRCPINEIRTTTTTC